MTRKWFKLKPDDFFKNDVIVLHLLPLISTVQMTESGDDNDSSSSDEKSAITKPVAMRTKRKRLGGREC